MFTPEDILYEDNHLLIVNKRCGDLVQPDPSGESALEDQIKAFVKRRDAKPGDVFLGVVHRIDNMAVMRSAKAGYAEEAAADEPLDFKTIKLQYNVQAKFVLE